MNLPANRFNMLRKERLRLAVTKLAAQPTPLITAKTAQPINTLQLTTRSENCLKAECIDTIDDLLKWSRAELLKTPNLGRRSADEIEDALDRIDLHLRGARK